MNSLGNPTRVGRLIESAITKFDLDCTGMTILTEAASGAFVVTSLIAALSGAERVMACVRDSRFGSAADVRHYVESWAANLGVQNRIEICDESPRSFAREADLVTNLGFVRPIDADFVSELKMGSAISLMWETWEYRPDDVDLAACRMQGIPVLGTDESDSRLEIFRYVGMIAVKLLLEAEVEIFRSRILVVGSDPFGSPICDVILTLGGEAIVLDPTRTGWSDDEQIAAFLGSCDAVVVAEQKSDEVLIGDGDGLSAVAIAQCGAPVLHISGVVDESALRDHQVAKHPPSALGPRVMSFTTGYVGPRPVIDLHCAGLAVGAAMVEGMRRYGDAVEAEKYALTCSPAMDWQGQWAR